MKLTYTFLLLLSFITSSYSQAPQGIPYQSAMRNSSGSILANQNVTIRFSVHDSSIPGNIVYQESHSATTSSQGIVSLMIGQGTPILGTFTGINWGLHSKFLQIEMDATGGNTYIDLGTQQMMSVPYALYAESVNNAPPPPKYSLGLYPELGGYVFWVSSDSLHGLVCETQDQAYNIPWYDISDMISNPSNHSIFGMKFRDWRIPSKFELNEMFVLRASIGGFINITYCSSSEFTEITQAGIIYPKVWFQDYTTGGQFTNGISGTGNVRSVRSF